MNTQDYTSEVEKNPIFCMALCERWNNPIFDKLTASGFIHGAAMVLPDANSDLYYELTFLTDLVWEIK